MKRFVLTLDLKDDPKLIAEYEEHHRRVWPEIIESITSSGIHSLQIYRLNSRMFMIMETEDDFSFNDKAKRDNANPVVQQWEELMWKYQQALPTAKPGEKWMLMNKIFDL